MWFAAAGLLLMLAVALLVGPPQQAGATSQPATSHGYDAFEARWPSGNINSGNDPHRDAMRLALAKKAGQFEPSLTASITFSAGVVGASSDWKDYVLTTQRASARNSASQFQAAHNRPSDVRAQQRPRASDNAATTQPKTELIDFATAPFPFEGVIPGTDRPFLNVVNGDQKGHRTSRGSVMWEDQTFNDSRVLLHIPKGFDINRPAVMVVFFHGHGANLTRDVLQRQNVPEQISLSGMNAVLVAPQFAVNAADSSPGRFWLPGGFARFVGEAGKKLAQLYGHPVTASQFANTPVIIVAYSGGYLPAAWSIRNGGLGKRLRGVVLLDGLYGQIDDFAKWIKKSPSVFFVSAYTHSTRRQNLELAQVLDENKVPYSTDIEGHLWRGGVALLSTSSNTRHRDFVTQAWTDNPIADILAKLN